jgi:hypothetical protein
MPEYFLPMTAASAICALSGYLMSRGSKRIMHSYDRPRYSFLTVGFACIAGLALLVAGAGNAEAVPAFAVQTGQKCAACHVGGFGPRLTPFGREFKLSGYTLRAGAGFSTPVSAMVVASYVHTAQDQPPAPHYAANDNLALDQASIFAAGGIGDHFGGLAQFTYDGIGRAFAWDNLDLRAVDRVSFAGSDALIGLSINNSPTVQDAWNTQSAWGFPYTNSALVPAPAAGAVLDGALAQSVLGASAYVWWASTVYAEFSLYETPSRGFLRAMGVDINGTGVISGVAPYLRVAYQKDYGDQNFQIGASAFFPSLYPGGDRSTGTSDHYADLGIDATYQFMGSGQNIYQVNARYTNERQTLNASNALGGAGNLNDTLQDFRTTVTYYWRNQIGGSVNFFDTWGSADPLLYAGNQTRKPDSTGFIFQIDVTPFGNTPSTLGPRANVRVGLQYTVYSKFNGAATNYDGLGHNASDNDAVRIFTWFAF